MSDLRFETKEEQCEREARDLPVNAFNAVTEASYWGFAMREALREDPAACEVFLRIAKRTRDIRNNAAKLASKDAAR